MKNKKRLKKRKRFVHSLLRTLNVRIAGCFRLILAARVNGFVFLSAWLIEELKMAMEKDIGELISQVRLRGLKPSQVFKADEIKEDPDFKKMIQAEVDYQTWLRQEQLEDEDNKDIQKEIEEDKLKSKENELIPDSISNDPSDDNDLVPD